MSNEFENVAVSNFLIITYIDNESDDSESCYSESY